MGRGRSWKQHRSSAVCGLFWYFQGSLHWNRCDLWFKLNTVLTQTAVRLNSNSDTGTCNFGTNTIFGCQHILVPTHFGTNAIFGCQHILVPTQCLGASTFSTNTLRYQNNIWVPAHFGTNTIFGCEHILVPTQYLGASTFWYQHTSVPTQYLGTNKKHLSSAQHFGYQFNICLTTDELYTKTCFVLPDRSTSPKATDCYPGIWLQGADFTYQFSIVTCCKCSYVFVGFITISVNKPIFNNHFQHN